MSKKKNIGSSFDEFLDREGILAETTIEAIKRVLSWQIIEMMKTNNISKTEMARRMGTSRSSLDRFLNPDNTSVTLKTIHRAAAVLGRRLKVELSE
jgi:DNA-binding Xre family transcriptional regulator